MTKRALAHAQLVNDLGDARGWRKWAKDNDIGVNFVWRAISKGKLKVRRVGKRMLVIPEDGPCLPSFAARRARPEARQFPEGSRRIKPAVSVGRRRGESEEIQQTTCAFSAFQTLPAISRRVGSQNVQRETLTHGLLSPTPQPAAATPYLLGRAGGAYAVGRQVARREQIARERELEARRETEKRERMAVRREQRASDALRADARSNLEAKARALFPWDLLSPDRKIAAVLTGQPLGSLFPIFELAIPFSRREPRHPAARAWHFRAGGELHDAIGAANVLLV